MNERERVLDLVRKGVLSTEEALDLLEGMARDKDEQQIKKEANDLDEKKVEKKDPAAKLVDEWEKPEVEEIKVELKNDEEDIEQILDDLATEANRLSAEIDEVDAEIKGVKVEIEEYKERVKEINTKQDLETISEEDEIERRRLESEIRILDEKLDDLSAEKMQLEVKLRGTQKEQEPSPEAGKDPFTGFDIPEDLKEQASETFNQVGEKLGEAGVQLGNILKKTVQGVSEMLGDNVDLKDLSTKIPGLNATKVEHVFEYPNTTATLIDVKLANGKVNFKSWDKDDVKVDAKIKLFGKMNEEDPFEAFEARSEIEVNEDQISFQIPNKRVWADLTFYLPKRTYDHVSVKLLNGSLVVDGLDAKDVFAKSSNGPLTFNQINATMLEIQGINGSINIKEGKILDTIVDTVNATFKSTANIQNYGVSLVNGDIKITSNNNDLKKIKANAVNGNLKVALPTNVSLEVEAKTSMGSVNRRMEDVEVIRDKKEKQHHMEQFRRVVGEEIAYIDLTTTTGNIFIKDVEN